MKSERECLPYPSHLRSGDRGGQILVESLIALAVGGTIILGLSGLLAISFNSAKRNLRSQAANLLLSECQDNIRSLAWDKFESLDPSQKYWLDRSSGLWFITPGIEQKTIDSINYERFFQKKAISRDQAGKIVLTGGSLDPSSLEIQCQVNFSGRQITGSIFISRHRNSNTWIQTTETDFRAGIQENVDITNISGGEVSLVKGINQKSILGNKFLISSLASTKLNSANYRISMRFTAFSDKAVNNVGIYLDQVTNRVTYRIGIQDDDNGLPTGIFLGSTTLSGGQTGWRLVTLSPTVNLVSGKIYHLVVEYQSGQISNRNSIGIRSTNPINNLLPYNNTLPLDTRTDTGSNLLFFNGTDWLTQNQQSLYHLIFSDNSLEGNPYDNFSEQQIFGANFYGQSLLVDQDSKLSAIWLYLARTAKSPNDNLYLDLVEESTGQVLISQPFGKPGVATPSWVSLPLSPGVDLKKGSTYRLSLRSPGSNKAGHYKINVAKTSNSSFNLATFGGIDSQATQSTDSGTNWTKDTLADFSGFKLDVERSAAGYASNGTFTSQIFDAAASAGFNRLSFNAQVSAATSLKFQIATADSASGPWDSANFLGPDGASSNFYITPSPIFFSQSGKRYFRFKAFLETSDPQLTPQLEEVRIGYTK